jgi:hypothetical protein
VLRWPVAGVSACVLTSSQQATMSVASARCFSGYVIHTQSSRLSHLGRSGERWARSDGQQISAPAGTVCGTVDRSPEFILCVDIRDVKRHCKELPTTATCILVTDRLFQTRSRWDRTSLTIVAIIAPPPPPTTNFLSLNPWLPLPRARLLYFHISLSPHDRRQLCVSQALRYKPEGRGFETRWGGFFFQFT